MERAYATVTLHIRDFIRSTLSTAGFSHVVVNISGGVDSAVTAALALEAVGPQHLFLAMMPYGEAGAQGLRNALLLIEALHWVLFPFYFTPVLPLSEQSLSVR